MLSGKVHPTSAQQVVGQPGRLKIEIQCSHRNTGPPAMLGYMFANRLRLFAFLSGIWERGVVDTQFSSRFFYFPIRGINWLSCHFQAETNGVGVLNKNDPV